jgi:SPP1 gp7 family putative phage head morphogenesis protein
MTDKQLQRQLDLMSSDTEKALYGYYKSSRETIKKYLSDLYEKYSKDGILSYSDMTKYNRLNSLNLFIADEMKSLGKFSGSRIKTLVGDLYNKAYFGYGDIIDQQANKSLNWGIVNRDTISSLINEPSVSGLSLIETLGKAQYKNLLKMRQTLTQSMIQGESYQDAARRISDEYDKSFNDAIRIARTEGTRASGEGQTAAYDRAEELGIVLKRIWVATDDARTRPSHLAMDGQEADEDGMFTIPDGYDNAGLQTEYPGGFSEPSESINCRCRVIAEVQD